MSAVIRLRTLVARYFSLSNEKADFLIGAGRVEVGGKKVAPATKIESWEEVRVDGKIIREGIKFSYVKFYKPRGIECTLNPEIPGNLGEVFQFPKKLFPVGRLDKESEGLLLLTDDGNLYREIAWSEKEKEKEYFVRVDKMIGEEFLEKMSAGIVIMGKKTKPAKLFAVPGDDRAFRIILTQGLNRQIRRMCYKLGYEVEKLVRTRIDTIELGQLLPGQSLEISAENLEPGAKSQELRAKNQEPRTKSQESGAWN
jgi:23S rRNA pseudouridine2604 synthase